MRCSVKIKLNSGALIHVDTSSVRHIDIKKLDCNSSTKEMKLLLLRALQWSDPALATTDACLQSWESSYSHLIIHTQIIQVKV